MFVVVVDVVVVVAVVCVVAVVVVAVAELGVVVGGSSRSARLWSTHSSRM